MCRLLDDKDDPWRCVEAFEDNDRTISACPCTGKLAPGKLDPQQRLQLAMRECNGHHINSIAGVWFWQTDGCAARRTARPRFVLRRTPLAKPRASSRSGVILRADMAVREQMFRGRAVSRVVEVRDISSAAAPAPDLLTGTVMASGA